MHRPASLSRILQLLANRLEHPRACLFEPFFDRYVFGLRKSCADDRGEKELVADVFPECAISLELRFAEELISCRMMRKCRLIQPVSLDELALIAGERQLQIKQISELLALGLGRIPNSAESEMGAAQTVPGQA